MSNGVVVVLTGQILSVMVHNVLDSRDMVLVNSVLGEVGKAWEDIFNFQFNPSHNDVRAAVSLIMMRLGSFSSEMFRGGKCVESTCFVVYFRQDKKSKVGGAAVPSSLTKYI